MSAAESSGGEVTRSVAWVTPGRGSRDVLDHLAGEFQIDLTYCGYEDVRNELRARRYDVVGIEIGSDVGQAVQLIREIRERFPRVTVFAATSDATVAAIRGTLEAGAAEVLALPLNAQEVSKAFIKHTQVGTLAGAPALVGDIIAVYAARGGLGATTLAVNLAVKIGQLTGVEVALVDLDLQRGDVAAFLNLSPLQSIATIAAAHGDVDEIFLHGTMTRHPSGVHVLPAPPQIEEAELVGADSVTLSLGLLRTQFRYTVIDTARTITGATAAALEIADRVLVMTDLSVPGVRAAQRALGLFTRLGIPSSRVDMLIAQTTSVPLGAKDLVRTIGKEPLMTLPRDDVAARHAMNAGIPLNGGKPSTLAVAIADLASRLAGSGAEHKPKRPHLLRRIFTREVSK